MKRNILRIISALLIISLSLTLPFCSYAADETKAPEASDFNITNNAGSFDTIDVSDVSGGDLIKVYTSATGGKMIASKAVASGFTDVTINVSQLGSTAGSVYISITSSGQSESNRVKVDYDAEAVTDEPTEDSITVTNNAGMADTVEFSNLISGDRVKVYNAAKGGKLLGTGSATASNTEATVSISQIGAVAGTIYVTVKNSNKLESARVRIDFESEPKSDPLSVDNIIITNNAGAADSVYISNLTPGDVAKVYNDPKAGKILGMATVQSNKDDVTITIGQLGTMAGSIYVSIINKGKSASDRVKVDFDAEQKTNPIPSDSILVTNNPVGTPDIIEVDGVSTGDVVKIYNAVKGGKLLAYATVPANSYQIIINVLQLGATNGNVYITITSKGMAESDRIQQAYEAEPTSDSPVVDNITVINNAGNPDTIYVTGISAGDIVKVYNLVKSGRLLGSAIVQANKSEATVTISQLGINAGTVFVTVTSKGKLESPRIPAIYTAEGKSDIILVSNVNVTNNAVGTLDTILVTGLTSSDVVKVYNVAKGGSAISSGTVPYNGTELTISIAQLGISSGSVYLTLSRAGKYESDRVKVDYLAEATNSAPTTDNIVVSNVAGMSDTIDVYMLSVNDVVKVYDSARGGLLLGTGTVATNKTSLTISINQLGSTAGSVYVSITAKGKKESDRTKVDYAAESKSSVLSADNITIKNNPIGTSDTIEVIGISANDIINVYDSPRLGNLLGSITASGSSATVTLTQLGSSGGTVYVTITNKKKLESDRTAVNFTDEASTNPLSKDNVVIVNNAGNPDTVSINSLTSGDIVRIYDLSKGGNILGTATVSNGSTTCLISIAQLGMKEGSVYVSLTTIGKLESARTKVDFGSEAKTVALDAANVVIINNAKIADIIKVFKLSPNDVVKVYDTMTGGNVLGTGTVAMYDSEVSVAIAQLSSTEGTVYITVTNKNNKLESDRTAVSYTAEPVSIAPLDQNISIVNNARMAATVTVKGLVDGDIVNIYDSASRGTLLGTGTVQTYSTEVTVSVSQLGATAGSVYVSVTSNGKLESLRTKADYSAKGQSNAPSVGDVIVQNNSGSADIVTVNNLAANDIVKVYDADTKGNLLGTATVANNGSQAIITITQLGINAGNIYVTITGTGKLESERSQIAYVSEQTSNAPSIGNISVVNNAGAAGVVTVTGLAINDVVKVYDSVAGGNLLGSATINANSLQASINIPQLGLTAGSVYVSVTSTGKGESPRTKADFTAVSDAPSIANISITNNAGTADAIVVSGLKSNDLVRVYDSAQNGRLLGYATVQATATQTTVLVSQLTSTAGSIYISVTSFGRTESVRTRADYVQEQQSYAPSSGNVMIINNPSGKADTITVIGLVTGDLVKVYDSAQGGYLLGYATVSSGNVQALITISQLGTYQGAVFISVTSQGKTESERVEADFMGE